MAIRHLTPQLMEQIFKMRDAFIFSITGRELFKYQKQFSDKIIYSVMYNKGKVIPSEWARQSGKTTTVTDTIVFLLLFYFPICNKMDIKTTSQFNIGWFAPLLQQSQSGFNMLRDTLKLCEGKGFDFTFETFNGNEITIKSANFPVRRVYCMTASPTSKQESKTLNLIIFDEAQDLMDNVVDKAISPMGAATNATEVWIGVAGYRKCKFQKFIERMDWEDKIIVPYELVLSERKAVYEKTKNEIMMNYSLHIEKCKKENGEESDAFRTQYKLQWILERGQFITFNQLMSLQADYEVVSSYEGANICYGGIDWGKVHDSTILTVVDKEYQIVAWYEWLGDDYASQIKDIVNLMYSRFKSMVMLHCDSTGTQDMAVDILQRELQKHQVRVVPVKFTPQSKDEMYKNLSRLMHPVLSGGYLLEKAKLKFPSADSLMKEKFVKQMMDLQKEVKGELWRCNHPAGIGYHDDYSDSVSLACLGFLPKQETAGKYKPMIA